MLVKEKKDHPDPDFGTIEITFKQEQYRPIRRVDPKKQWNQAFDNLDNLWNTVYSTTLQGSSGVTIGGNPTGQDFGYVSLNTTHFSITSTFKFKMRVRKPVEVKEDTLETLLKAKTQEDSILNYMQSQISELKNQEEDLVWQIGKLQAKLSKITERKRTAFKN